MAIVHCVVISIPLRGNDVEHLIMYLLTYCEVSVQIFSPFFIVLCVLLILSCRSSFHGFVCMCVCVVYTFCVLSKKKNFAY